MIFAMRARPALLFAAVLGLAAAPPLAAQWQEAKPAEPLPPARFDAEPALIALAQANATADADRRVGPTAWTLLALLADGSTMRTGPHKDPIRRLAAWLKSVQDESGRFTAPAASSRTDQLVATLAVAEAGTLSNYTLLKPIATRGTLGIESLMLGAVAQPPTPEDFIASILVARGAPSRSDGATSQERCDKVLAHARAAMVLGPVRRTDAALHLDELLQGKVHPPELTVARCWPGNPLADPLHTLVGTLAVIRTGMHQQARTAHFDTLAPLVAARATEGGQAGTWEPAAGFDRTATTAMHTITLVLANGRCRLSFAK